MTSATVTPRAATGTAARTRRRRLSPARILLNVFLLEQTFFG